MSPMQELVQDYLRSVEEMLPPPVPARPKTKTMSSRDVFFPKHCPNGPPPGWADTKR